jgi:hypothetical protein
MLQLLTPRWIPSGGKWVADPILHSEVADTHWTCDGHWTPRTPTRPWQAESLRVSSIRERGETWPPPGSDGVGLLQRSSHQSGRKKSLRSSCGGTAVAPGACQLAPGWTRLEELAQSRAPGHATERTSLDMHSDPGAMQILANTAKHVDAVPDFVERRRNECLTSLSRLRAGVTRVKVPARRRKRRSGKRVRDFAGNRPCGVGIPASSFEVTVLDGRLLSWRGSRG